MTVQYFLDPRLLDKAATKAYRDWEDVGWVSEPFDNWVPTGHRLSK